MLKPKVVILKAEGTNFDEETAYAFNQAGGNTRILLMSEVLKTPNVLRKFQILDFPGGFSYGDDLYSGKIWANEINAYIRPELDKFIKKGGIIFGVCNGFQVLVRAGILPGFGEFNQTIGLIINKQAKFECRWINLRLEESRCKFLEKSKILQGPLTVEHGEGRFIIRDKGILNTLLNNKQIVFRYIEADGMPTENYPDNPNGSSHAIAGICDTTGQVLGMMPHPEHFMKYWQYPNWRREKHLKPFGLEIYKSAISYLKKN